MRKILDIACKDLLINFRDPAALVMMLVTPFIITLVIGFAFGGPGGGGGGGLSGIPVIIVNRDAGDLGAHLVETFAAEELADLVTLTVADDEATARARVDADEAAAVIIIPADFSASFAPTAGADLRPCEVEIYANPARPISAGVIRGIVSEFLSRLVGGMAGAEVSIAQLTMNGLLSPQEVPRTGAEIGARAAQEVADLRLVAVRSEMSSDAPGDNSGGGFSWVAYMAPSLAIMFLMFTVTAGGRSILAERREGTLSRLLISPTTAAQILGGKMLGIYLTGVAQMIILIAASSALFDVRWGAPLPLTLLVAALIAAATCWGMLLAAYARTPGQANAIGTALTLVFGGCAGNFLPRQWLPEWLKTISLISPNAWGLEGFITLSRGGGLPDLGAPIVALLVMAVVVFGVSLPAFRRQYQ